MFLFAVMVWSDGIETVDQTGGGADFHVREILCFNALKVKLPAD